MPHARKTIRDTLATLLTGLATTGANVFSGRVEPLPQASLPALIVRAVTEERDADRDTISMADTPRRLTVLVQAHIASGGDDTLDQIALEVETAIESNPTLSGTVKWIAYQSTELLRTTDGEVDHAALLLRYEAIYTTQRTNPGTAV